jgi:hypothetical protein
MTSTERHNGVDGALGDDRELRERLARLQGVHNQVRDGPCALGR